MSVWNIIELPLVLLSDIKEPVVEVYVLPQTAMILSNYNVSWQCYIVKGFVGID